MALQRLTHAEQVTKVLLERLGKITAIRRVLEELDTSVHEELAEVVRSSLRHAAAGQGKGKVRRTDKQRRTVRLLTPRPPGEAAGAEDLVAYGVRDIAELTGRTRGAVRKAIARRSLSLQDFDSVMRYYARARGFKLVPV
jgi:hypothetical protein